MNAPKTRPDPLPTTILRLSRLITVLAWITGLAAIVIYTAKIYDLDQYTDFQVYYQAALRASQGLWDQVYNLRDGASPFRYPPLTLPLFWPFGFLSLRYARTLMGLLNILCFVGGFWMLYRSMALALRPMRGRWPASALTALVFFLVLRFTLDTLTIGQVSGVMFLALQAMLLSWLTRRPTTAGFAWALPTLLKIGPGILAFPIILSTFWRRCLGSRRRQTVSRFAVGATLLLVLLTGLLLMQIAGTPSLFNLGQAWDQLWQGWVLIVQMDSTYYDASHYGNQSLKGAALRFAFSHWVDTPDSRAAWAHLIDSAHLALVALVSSGLFIFFSAKKLSSPRAKFLSIGLLAGVYVLLMPESFKYTQTVLAFTLASLLIPRAGHGVDPIGARPRPASNTLGARVALALFALGVSIAGLDVIGPDWFFDLQRASVPCLLTLFITLIVWIELRHETSTGSRVLPPWPKDLAFELAKTASNMRPSSQMYSVVVPIRAEAIQRPLLGLRGGLESLIKDSLAHRDQVGEILLAPYGDKFSSQVLETCRIRIAQLPDDAQELFKILQPVASLGQAVRDGALTAQGQWIWVYALDQPFTASTLNSDAELIHANRRDPETRFQIAVRLLPLVFGRHRLARTLNTIEKSWFGLALPNDLHSGNIWVKRELALKLCFFQTETSACWELEWCLHALQLGSVVRSASGTVRLSREKSGVQIVRQTFEIARSLWNLRRRMSRNFVGRLNRELPSLTAGTADDYGMSFGINRGIRDLARVGVLKRTSVLVDGEACTSDELRRFREIPGTQVGLHWNLTYPSSSPGREFKRAIFQSSQFRNHAASELKRQLDALRSLTAQVDFLPAYLDSHHHVHLSAGGSTVIARTLELTLRDTARISVRLPFDPTRWTRGRSTLNLLALQARRWRWPFTHLKFRYPSHFELSDPAELLAEWVDSPDAEWLFHPAAEDDLASLKNPDPYAADRVIEYRVLNMIAWWINQRRTQ